MPGAVSINELYRNNVRKAAILAAGGKSSSGLGALGLDDVVISENWTEAAPAHNLRRPAMLRVDC